MQSKPGNVFKENVNPPPQHRVHDPNEPIPGNLSGQPQQFEGRNALNSERPLNVQPTPAGGVARGGQADRPMGEATLMDKVIGKTEKVIGKVTGNQDRHEAGELREAGGKKAVTGEARALHD